MTRPEIIRAGMYFRTLSLFPYEVQPWHPPSSHAIPPCMTLSNFPSRLRVSSPLPQVLRPAAEPFMRRRRAPLKSRPPTSLSPDALLTI